MEMVKNWPPARVVVNLGSSVFARSVREQGARVFEVDWRPPALGRPELIRALEVVQDRPDVDEANRLALERYSSARPTLVGIGRARDVIPGLGEYMLLHAGPPINWERMAGPLRGAVIGAILYEGWASSAEEAEKAAAGGEIAFSPCHEHSAVGPMAGVVSPSMPVFVIENRSGGNRSYCTLNEGLGKVLRYGAYSAEVLERLRWMADVLAPVLAKGIELSGGIDLRSIIAQALHMGDEVHNRNRAATSLFIRSIAPHLVETGYPISDIRRVLEFINGNDHFFLNLSMPAAKAMLEAAHGVPKSTMVTVMSRNGTDFGIKVSGLGDRWFTGPAQKVRGLYFSGFGEDDANLDIGDSSITETAGLGGFAMAAAIPIVQFVGGTPDDAVEFSKRMYGITLSENRFFTIPVLGFRGTPTGIDLRKVVERGILPQINTGIAHKDPGIGQVGAGLVTPPWECFEKALLAFVETYA
ncbi:MAG: DUF1116 domain-containing protein [Firmicutes bacterium]|jgi:hypothetical protein|nr:DUF1116 domain-containing protein [Bacillota bacterium]MDH7495673.1 DUF1116 domain-containing protein [Bacillota bacterium]